jgi:Ca2+/Na+ antiporter
VGHSVLSSGDTFAHAALVGSFYFRSNLIAGLMSMSKSEGKSKNKRKRKSGGASFTSVFQGVIMKNARQKDVYQIVVFTACFMSMRRNAYESNSMRSKEQDHSVHDSKLKWNV